MAKSRLIDNNSRRVLRGTIGFSPVFALLVASQPGTAVAATLPASNVVSVCSGVSLPRSVVTDIVSPVITGTINPLQTSVNSLLSGVLGAPQNTVNAAQLLSNAAAGQPITLQALSTAGTVIGPNSSCYSQASGFTLATPAGLAIGGNQITGLGNGAVANAGEVNSIAFGNGASTDATASGAIALGSNALVGTAATGSVALGTGASAVAANSVALGASSVATRGALGTYTGYALSAPQSSAGEVSIGAAGAARQLTNVAAGSSPTDAVNVAQLTAVNGQVTTNTNNIATIQGTVSANSTAITANTNAIGTLANAAVQYSDAGHTTLALGGTGAPPVALTNVQAVPLTATSTAAVNGSQLFATNANVTANTSGLAALGTQTTTNTNAIGTLSNLAVEYTDPLHTAVTLGGTGSAPVALTNVQAVPLTATSTAAVNGSQLFATNANVATNTSGLAALGTTVGSQGTQITANTNAIGTLSNLAVEYTDPLHTAVTLGGTGSAPVALTNVQAVPLTATSTAAVNGSQLFATNANVASNSGAIGTLQTDVGANTTLLQQQGSAIGVNADAIVALRRDTADGAIGPVQYSNSGTPTLPNGGTPTNDLTLVGRDPTPVGLHNVADGVVAAGSTDGVNGGQLFALSNQFGSLSSLAVEYDDATKSSISLGNGTNPVLIHNVQAGMLGAASTDAVNGAQLFATNSDVAANTGNIATLTTTVGNQGAALTQDGIAIGANASALVTLRADTSNGAIGPVQYSSSAMPVTPDGGVPSNDLTLVGARAAPVALHNVADGSVAAGSTDAVNGGQLFALSSSVGSLSTLAVEYDDASRSKITLSNAAGTPVALTGLAAGSLTASSSDAVNGAQLFATNQSVAQLSASVDGGGIGPVQYSSAANPATPDGGVASQDLTLVGAATGPVALHNLAAGSLAAGSTDAVNGSQLGALGIATASVFGAGYTYNPATNSYSGSFSYGGNAYSNLQAALNAVQTSVAAEGNPIGDSGIKYFHTTSTMADSSATGADSTAIGPSSVSSGDASIAVGRGAAASGASAVAIGDGAMAQDGKAVSIGVGNMASGDGAVAIGDPNVATGVGATALGENNTASGDGAIALGNTNSATGQGAAAIGYVNTSNGDGATAIGYQNNANGSGAVAIGSNNVASGGQSLAIGTNVQTTATDTLAIGSHATSSGTSSVTVGNRTIASGTSAVAVGNDTQATGALSGSFGERAVANSEYALAIGAQSAATSFAGTAIGAGATASGFASAALGTGSIASNDGSVALGSASQTVRGAVADYSAFGLTTDQSSAGEIAVARNISYTDPTTGGPTLTGTRQITGVAAGSADTDAVNVSQLRGVSSSIGSIVAAGLGGGSSYNPTTGQLTAPSYTLGGVTYGNVGDALQALATNTAGAGTGATGATGATGGTGATGSSGGAVTFTDASHSTVALAPTGSTIQNVAAGAVTPTSTDAVNGSQLAATNAAVATNSSAISTLATQVSNGAVGVVRYANAATPTTANGGTQTNDATLVGQNAAAPVALHNVAAGSVAVGSTDAVNGGQLAATNAAVATAQTTANTALTMSSNSVQYDSPSENSVTLGNAGSGAVSVHNVAPGISPSDAANVGQVSAAMAGAVSQANGYTDGRIAALSFDLRKVQREANAGAAGAMALAGMPQPYEAGKGMVSMGAGTFQGQTAIALGVAKALSDGHTVVKLGATYNSRGMVGANAGVGWQF